MAEESGDIYSKAHAYTAHGCSCLCKGFLKEAEEHLLKGADFCERMKWFLSWSFAHQFLGETYFEMGEYQTSQEHQERAISLLERGRLFPSLIGRSKIALARAKVMNNEKDINLSEIFKCYEDNKVKQYEGSVLRYIGEILLNIDDQHMNEAEDWIRRAIEADKRNGMMFELGMDYASYAELLKRKGDLSQAKENLNTAIEIYKECGADGWVKRAQEALA